MNFQNCAPVTDRRLHKAADYMKEIQDFPWHVKPQHFQGSWQFHMNTVRTPVIVTGDSGRS